MKELKKFLNNRNLILLMKNPKKLYDNINVEENKELIYFKTSLIIREKNIRKKKTFQKSKYSHKNFIQLIGKTIISNISSENLFSHSIKVDFLKRKYENIIYPNNFEEYSTDEKFKNWITEHNLRKKYVNLFNFRKIWIIDGTNSWNDQHFSQVLKNITKYFLENECTYYLISLLRDRKFKMYNLESYLSCIPIFLRGIENPEKFNSII